MDGLRGSTSARASAIGKAVFVGVLLFCSAHAQQVSRTPTSVQRKPSRTAPFDPELVLAAINDTAPVSVGDSSLDAPFTAGKVHSADALSDSEAEVIGGPKTRSPAPTASELPSTLFPLTFLPISQPTFPTNTTPTVTPFPQVPDPTTEAPESISAPSPTDTTVNTTAPSLPPKPDTAATNATAAPNTTTMPSTTTPLPSDRGIDPAHASASPQTPQALELAPRRANKTWLIMAFVGGIVAIATGVAMLLWRDTRRYKSRSERGDQTAQPHNKTISSDMERDWYEASPSLSSLHPSVDTFMGPMPRRKPSDAHVSSRAASTAELLNVSSAGERSTRSDPSDRSQSAGGSNSSSSAGAATMRRGFVAGHPVDETTRGSSPQISFDDDVNAVIDWLDPMCALSAQSLHAHRISSVSPTESDLEEFTESIDGDESDSGRTLRRYSNGSTYSAVPSCSSAILGECPSVRSSASDWSRM